jgi:hypothetical protein
MKSRCSIVYFSLLLCITISGCSKDNFLWNLVSRPEISKTILIGNSVSSVTVESSLISNGNDKNTIKGFCWSIQSDPDFYDFKYIFENSKEEKFSYSIPWSFNGTMYIRSFAINKLDTVYSDVISTIWTGDAGNMPQVQTNSITEIEFYNAKVNCQLISTGNLTIVEQGVFLSENSQPSESNSTKILDASGSSNFNISLSNLQENRTYYVRAFAKNFAFTGLGNILSFTTNNFYNVGELGPAGGRIFYSKPDTIGGWNFLEAAPQDYNNQLDWSPSNAVINNTSTSIGSGDVNTNSIINIYGNNSLYSAYAGSIYSLNGFLDWFLPSRDELIKMYQNLYLNGLGSFVLNTQYWSSSEDEFYSQNAWSVKMSVNEEVTTFPKSNNYKSRFIRKF